MGTSGTSFTSSHLETLQSLQYYTSVDDPNAGFCQVYSLTHLPLCFVAKVKRRTPNTSLLSRKIEDQSNRALVRLYAFGRVKVCEWSRGQGEGVIYYWQYYNFYFDTELQRKRLKKEHFYEGEIWHLIATCVRGYQTFKKHGVVYPFSPGVLVVTPEGKLRLVWVHVREYNLHLPYLKHFQGVKQENLSEYFSPEELYAMRTNQPNINLDFQKCDVFSFGMLLLFATTLCDPLTLPNSQYHFNTTGIETLINRAEALYSTQICTILRECLDVLPTRRCSFQHLLLNYSNQMHDNHSIVFHPPLTSEDNRSQSRRISIKRTL